MPLPLFITKSNGWIDTRCPPGGNVSGHQAGADQDSNRSEEAERIGSAQAIEHLLHETSTGKLLRILHGKRTQHYRVDKAKDGHVGANAKGK